MCPSLTKTNEGKDILVIGQKSSLVWFIDPDNGQILSSVLSGPAGIILGGNNWGGLNHFIFLILFF
jgi:hypothetical protein